MTKSIAQSFINAAELRSGGVITEAEINALKNRWSGHRRKDAAYEQQLRVEQFGPYRISDEQCAKGLAWWRAQLFTKKGALRMTQFVLQVSAEVAADAVAHVVRTATHFELADFDEEWNNAGMCWIFPRYRLCGAGKRFTYTARPWQSGRDANNLGITFD